MPHDWNEGKSYSLEEGTAFRRVRFCENCGAIQEMISSQLWGRVVSRRWWPKVWRCGPTAFARSRTAWAGSEPITLNKRGGKCKRQPRNK